MAVCGAGCMGFVNVARGLRAVGYVEPDLRPGPVALITHSGSVFSALLRARRGFGFSLAVSSGQELVTTAAAYARYALSLPETRVLALVLEAIRDAAGPARGAGRALAADVPVVLLSVGASQAGQALVSAHSGALAAADGAWEALAGAYGVHRVGDLAELADTLELFCRWTAAVPYPARASPPCTTPAWNARTSPISPLISACRSRVSARATRQRLAAALDPGLTPGQPAGRVGDRPRPRAAVHRVPVRAGRRPGRARRSRSPSTWCPNSTATTPTRGPCSRRPRAPPSRSPCWPACPPPSTRPPPPGCARQACRSSKAPAPACSPCATCSTTPAAAASPRPRRSPVTPARAGRTAGPATARRAQRRRPVRPAARLRHPGGPRPGGRAPAREALQAAAEIGYPVVLKTDEPRHRAQVRRRRGAARPRRPRRGRRGLRRPGRPARPPHAGVPERPPGTELALGIVRDAALGPLLVISAGGILIEIFSERVVVLPPVTRPQARAILTRAACRRRAIRGPWPAAADLERSRTRSSPCPASPATSATSWTRWTSTR